MACALKTDQTPSLSHIVPQCCRILDSDWPERRRFVVFNSSSFAGSCWTDAPHSLKLIIIDYKSALSFKKDNICFATVKFSERVSSISRGKKKH